MSELQGDDVHHAILVEHGGFGFGGRAGGEDDERGPFAIFFAGQRRKERLDWPIAKDLFEIEARVLDAEAILRRDARVFPQNLQFVFLFD